MCYTSVRTTEETIKHIRSVNLGTGSTFADIGATVCDILGVDGTGLGTSVLDRVRK